MKDIELTSKSIHQKKDLEGKVDFYKSIADHTYDLEVFQDANGKIVYMNQAFVRITGFSVEDVINGSVTEKDLVHPDDLEMVRSEIRQAISHKNVEDFDFRIIRKDGEIRYLNLFSVPVFKKKTFIGTRASIRDITYQKDFVALRELREKARQKEEELKIALENLQFHVDNTPFGVVIFDSEFRVTKWSDKAIEMFGWSSGEIIGKAILDLSWIDDDEKEKISLFIADFITHKKLSNTIIIKNYRKDGSVIICEWNISVMTDPSGEILSIHSLVKDITESEDLKKRLSHSYMLMQYVIEYDRSAIALLNRDLVYIYVSKKFLKDYKVKEKDVIGKRHYEVFPDLPESWKEVHQRTLNGEVLSAEDDQYPKSDGSVEWIRWESRPWYEPDGIIGGIILYTEVITQKKEAELELIKSKEQAVESDRLKTAFLNNMSHEVRTPLNAIVGFSDLLSEHGKSIADVKTFSKIISENCDKLIRIISDVIEVSKIHAKQTRLELKNFDVVSLITQTSNTFREFAERKNISLILKQDIPIQRSFVYSDNGKLEKILIHLIDNAIKFTNKGSVEVVSELQQENLVLTVTDTGIGISEEMQLIIFEPFQQLETRITMDYGGNGLGLAIVRAYTELLGGIISLKSDKITGTMITISIPISKASMGLTDNTNDITSVKNELSGSTILIAEDEYGNYRYLFEVLHADKMNVLHAQNGQEAIDMCKDIEDISLVLMDIKMPVMNGITAARLIKEFRPDLPIIAQTAYAGESAKLTNVEVFDDLIAKPINRNELKRKMKRFINYG